MSVLPSRSQLRWRCRRGTLELDTLMNHYLEHAYEQASESEKRAFMALIALPDEVLQTVILEEGVLEQEALMTMIQKMKALYRDHVGEVDDV